MIAPLRWNEADRLARSFPNRAVGGLLPEAVAIHQWDSWPTHEIPGQGTCLGPAASPHVVLWCEPDAFNSTVLGFAVARLHWRLAPGASRFMDIAELMTGNELVSIRVIGQDNLALLRFQEAGWRVVLASAWLHRASGPPPSLCLPAGFDIEVRHLRRSPLSLNELEEWIDLAHMCFFDDRFSLDVRINSELTKARYLATVRNALSGGLADWMVSARKGGCPAAVVYFGADEEKPRIAGRWLTELVHPEWRGGGLGSGLLAHSIGRLPGAPRPWTYSAALHNLASFEAHRRLGFRLGAVVYDLHWWAGP